MMTETDSSENIVCYMCPLVPAQTHSDKFLFYDFETYLNQTGITSPFYNAQNVAWGRVARMGRQLCAWIFVAFLETSV